MTTDHNESGATKLDAIREAPYRAGLKPPTTVDLEMGSRAFEQILDSIETGSRAEYRRAMGRDDPNADYPPARADRSRGLPRCA